MLWANGRAYVNFIFFPNYWFLFELDYIWALQAQLSRRAGNNVPALFKTLCGHLLQICNVSSLFIYSLWSFQSRLSMSADLQRLNICFYFGNTFVTLFSFWCQTMLGIKCLVEETSSVTCIAAFKSSGCMCPGEFVFYCDLSKACLTRFCR